MKDKCNLKSWPSSDEPTKDEPVDDGNSIKVNLTVAIPKDE